MSLLKAPVYGFDDKFHYGKLGDVVWDGKRVSTEGRLRDPDGLQEILGPYEVTDEGKITRFDPDSGPEEWIKNLYRRYRSAELRVYRANGVPTVTKITRVR